MAVVPEQIENRVTMGSSSSTSGYSQKNWKLDLNRFANIHGTLIHSSQEIEDTQVFFDRWMDKVDVICTYTGLCFTLKKEILAHAPTQMNPEDVMLSSKR